MAKRGKKINNNNILLYGALELKMIQKSKIILF